MLASSSGELRLAAGHVFDEYDPQRSGRIGRWAYHFAFTAVFGMQPSVEELTAVFGEDELRRTATQESWMELDHGGDGAKAALTITREAFVDRVSDRCKYQSDCDPAWAQFDAIDAKGRGYITLDEFCDACSTHAPNVSREVARHAFKSVDGDGDGRVTFRDFRALTAASPAYGNASSRQQ